MVTETAVKSMLLGRVAPLDEAEDPELPPWALGVIRSRPPEATATMRRWSINWLSLPGSRLRYALVPGATVVALDLSNVTELNPERQPDVQEAVTLITEQRTTPLEIGVLAYSGFPRVPPDVVAALAQRNVVLAGTDGEDAVQRAKFFVRGFRERANRQGRNFSEYLKRVQTAKEDTAATR